MCTLEKLIAQLCPDGVEYKPLGGIAKVCRGVRVVKAQLSKEGKYPVYQNSIAPLGYHSEYNCKAGTPFVIAAGAAGEIGYCDVDFWAADDCYYIETDKNLNGRFVYYCLMTMRLQLISKVRKASVPRLARSFVDNLEIPLPPLSVQKEIVRMLDDMAGLIDTLEEELAARKKQYEWYAKQILEQDDMHFAKVSEIIVSLRTGLNPRKNFKLNEPGAKCPYITGKDVFANQVNVSERTALISEADVLLINKRAHIESGDVMFASTGCGTVGRMAPVMDYDNSWAVSETMYMLKPKHEIVDQMYLIYMLSSNFAVRQYKPRISLGSVPHLKVADLLNVEIPLPSLSEQRRIVKRLDSFDALCNSLTAGLPGEIALRKQQYEFYRDKLLTFKKAV